MIHYAFLLSCVPVSFCDRQTVYVFLTVTAYPDRQLLRVTSIGTHVNPQ